MSVTVGNSNPKGNIPRMEMNILCKIIKESLE